MSIGQISLAAALAVSLAYTPAATPLHPLGIVTEANDASLGHSSVSPGATLYEGDRLTTESAGALRLRSSAAMIYLRGSSAVTLCGMLENDRNTEVELASGTLLFSTSQAAAIEVRADDASAALPPMSPPSVKLLSPVQKNLHLRPARLADFPVPR